MYVNAPGFKEVEVFEITGAGSFSQVSKLDLEMDMPEGWVDEGSVLVVSPS